MATPYDPNGYLGERLSMELKLATFRTPCPEGVWDALEREREVRKALGAKKPKKAPVVRKPLAVVLASTEA